MFDVSFFNWDNIDKGRGLSQENAHQGWKMASLFSYKCFDVELHKQTRTLSITSLDSFLSKEYLFELESILAWSANKKEIHSIFISSSQDVLSKGLKPEYLKDLDDADLQKIYLKIELISQAFQVLPQTLIVDINKGLSQLGIDLYANADLLLAHKDSEIHFNHLQFGLFPSTACMAQLYSSLSAQILKNALLSSQLYSGTDLFTLGVVTKTYHQKNHTKIKQEILENIAKQSPVARIQLKHNFQKNFTLHFDQLKKFSIEARKAYLITEDWKQAYLNPSEFLCAKHFSYAAQSAKATDTNQDKLAS